MQMTGAQLVQVPFTKMKNIHFSVQTISATQLHAHTGMELGLVLSGNLEVHSGSQTKTLSKQDLLLLNGYQPHNMCSADGATVLFLQISSGFGKEFLRLPLTPMEEPFRAAMFADMRKLGIEV